MIPENTLVYYVTQILNGHIHQEQLAFPWGAIPVQVTSAAGAFNWGGYSADIIPAAATAYEFDLHWAVISNASANADYEMEFYYGPTDIMASRAKFSRTAPFTSSATIPLMSHLIPAGQRVRARLRDSAGASNCFVAVFCHEYEPH